MSPQTTQLTMAESQSLARQWGGAATWYLISDYPELFAAGAPFRGYCDYRLWKKPNGYTFHLQEWGASSWEARSAAFLIDNLSYTPVWMVHDE